MGGVRRVHSVILGGGCAGLTLAVELTKRGFDESLLIVEPRKHYTNDRTWCYWNVAPHSFTGCISHRWSAWSTRSDEWDVTQHSTRYAYEHIPSDRFYAAARHTLKGCPNVVIATAVNAVSVHGRDHRFFVSTTEGPVEAQYVFDSRPPTLVSQPPALWQHFVGWRVQTLYDAFDPSRVMLMDFAPASDNGILFFYLLPYSEREALVEATFLTRAIIRDATHYESVLRRYLRDRLGGRDYQVNYREHGAIPMGLEAPAGGLPPAGYVPIGTRGGFVRPSTGYAFLATQSWCQSFAENFIRTAGAVTPLPAYSRWARLLDRIFLQHLLDAPALAPRTFMRLFQRTTPEATVRFLTDQASRHDYVSVISAMPTLPFIQAAISTASHSLTHRPAPSGWRSGRRASTTDFGIGPLLSHAIGRKRVSRVTP